MNPDWDKLEACQQSLREHMSEIERLKSDLDEWRRECRAEIERLKDMEQAYLEEVKLRLELEVEIERLREVIEEADRLIERYKPVSAMKLLKAALAGKETPKT